jgi:hypothetical protein
MLKVKIDDGPAFPRLEPVVAGDLAVVLIRFPVPLAPLVERSLGNGEPLEELFDGDFSLGLPVMDVVDQAVACVRGNPASV